MLCTDSCSARQEGCDNPPPKKNLLSVICECRGEKKEGEKKLQLSFHLQTSGAVSSYLKSVFFPRLSFLFI